MAVTFNTNVSALTAQRYLGAAGEAAASSLSKLSSGSRVPTAKDDAAGLAIGTKLKAEVAGLQQAGNNAAQAISLLQIADGALATTSDVLQRMKSLAVQASSGQLSNADRSLLNQEFVNLRSEIDRIANITNFNGTNLLNGSTSQAVANANNLPVSNNNGAETLISEGVQSITFTSGFSAAAVKLSFDASNNTMTLTNLVNGQSDTVSVAAAAIATGETETLNFNNVGATVVLDSNFDKNVSSNSVNATRSASITTTSAGSDITSTSFTEFRLKGASGVTTQDFNGATFTWNTALASAATLSGTVGGTTFSIQNSGTVDLSTVGTKSVVLENAQGDEVTISVVVGTAVSNSDANTFAGTVRGINYGTFADVELSDITPSAAVTTSGTAGAITWSLNATTFTGTNPPLRSDLANTTITTTETAGHITFGTATVGGKTFTTTGYVDFRATGNNDVTFSDGEGNSFVLRGNVTSTDTDTNDTVANVTFANGDTTAPGVDQESVRVSGITKGATSTFDFGNIDDATITFGTGTAATSTASLTLNGLTFSASNIDLSTSGQKTVVLTNGSGTAATSITVQFNLTGALDDGDALQVEVGELGQLVGANTVTGGSTTFSFKVGTGVTSNDSISFSLAAVTTSQLQINANTIDTSVNADAAILAINNAINTVASRRADVGAAQSRLQFAGDSIAVAIENTTSAQSALLDVDVSSEITTFTSKQVLLQAGVSLLAQANQQPSLLLRLLQ